MFRLLKYIIGIVLGAAILFLAFLVYMTIIDYTPETRTCVNRSTRPDTISVSDTIHLFSWNIGYAGLDSAMDFFYDGGTQVRPSYSSSYNNLKSISNLIHSSTGFTDFFLLQEIDIKARRSYNMNQVDTIGATLPGYQTFFAKNYSVKWVPLPVTEPMGGVESGICLYSKYKAISSDRYSYPVNFSWPLKVFMLDRCFLVTRFHLSNGKQLLIINTHNSAFDSGGELRKAELSFFKDYLVSEYLKGNYVIAGGDFNQCPMGYKPSPQDSLFDREDFHTIPDSLFGPDWHFVYEHGVYTNRRVIAPYNPSTTKQTLIDFFITSPNVTTVEAKTVNLHYENSDHNPIVASFIMR